MKTIKQALIDEVHYPVPEGYVENVMIKRSLSENAEVTKEVFDSNEYKGATADCLYSLIQAMNIAEAGKSIGSLTDQQRKLILAKVNELYDEIGEPLVEDGEPMVFFGK